MKAIAHRLSRLKLTTFKVSFSPTYTSYLANHIAKNSSHPLFVAQNRRQSQIKPEGLLWHATNGVDISKSGCVRTWARRRLRHAFVEELKLRGYDETGKLIDAAAMQTRRDAMAMLNLGRSIDLTGSLRMHGVGPLIPAKFETVKQEMRSLVNLLIQWAVDTAFGSKGEDKKSSGVGLTFARTDRPSSQPRTWQERSPVHLPTTSKKQLDVETRPSLISPQVSSDAPNWLAKARAIHRAPNEPQARVPPPQSRVRKAVTSLDRGSVWRVNLGDRIR